ncbi:MAG: hypothetical protein R2909_14800, partial [Gemmatimonadales bacterium]
MLTTLWHHAMLTVATSAGLGPLPPAATAAPDPCALVTVAEVEATISRVKGTPKADREGAASWCDYQFVNGTDAFEVWVLPADGIERGRKKSKKPIAIKGLGDDAFLDRGMDGLDYANLFIKKGDTTIQLSLKESP